MNNNIYVISHHTFGMGHYSRAALVARAISEVPGTNVWHLSCGQPLLGVSTVPYVQFVQLPFLRRSSYSGLQESGDKTPIEAVIQAQYESLLMLFRENAPHMFVTEFYPFSPYRLDLTLLPILDHIRKHYPSCLIVCSARDIPVSDHSNEMTAWEYTRQLLQSYYKDIWIHSDPHFCPPTEIPNFGSIVDEFDIFFTGYISATHSAIAINETSSVLVTPGGGRDGDMLIRNAIEALKPFSDSYRVHVVCGPLMSDEDFQSCLRQANDSKTIRVVRYSSSLADIMRHAHMVISMAGYNTLVEIVSHKKHAVIVPRFNSFEQSFRATCFEKTGLLKVISEDGLTSDNLRSAVQSLGKLDGLGSLLPDLNGYQNVTERTRYLLGANS